MTVIVKIMSDQNLSDDDPRKSYSLHANVSNVSFVRNEDESAFARMYVRDDVKTAAVPGFSEHEVCADVPAMAYVMNQAGKTIGSFSAAPLPFVEEVEVFLINEKENRDEPCVLQNRGYRIDELRKFFGVPEDNELEYKKHTDSVWRSTALRGALVPLEGMFFRVV